jgi:hypothetical protein
MSEYLHIADPIEVVGTFRAGGFLPQRFKWKKTIYTILEITLMTDMKDAGVRMRQYSVVATPKDDLSRKTVYRLLYHRDHERWTLEDVWVE